MAVGYSLFLQEQIKGIIISNLDTAVDTPAEAACKLSKPFSKRNSLYKLSPGLTPDTHPRATNFDASTQGEAGRRLAG